MNQAIATDRFIAIGLGEILWDIFPSGKNPGGAPANFAYHLNSLGVKSYPVSSIGNDQLGNEIISVIKSKSLSTKYLQTISNFPTGTVEVELNEAGNPNYIITENVAWDNISMNADLVNIAKRCNVVCYGSLAQRSVVSKNTINEFLESTKESCIRIFDINLRQDYYTGQIIESSLQRSNVLKLNDDELQIVSSLLEYSGSEESIASQLMMNFSLDVLALTKGSCGSVLYLMDNISEMNTNQINIADTVGAGDAFAAGLAYGLLHQFSIDETHSIANNISSYVCSKQGATPTIGTEDLKRILNIEREIK